MRFAGDIFRQGGKFIKDNPWAVPLAASAIQSVPAFMGSGLGGSFGGFGSADRGYSDNDSGWQHLGKTFLGPGLGGLIGKDFT
jgi:hypothetical protein